MQVLDKDLNQDLENTNLVSLSAVTTEAMKSHNGRSRCRENTHK